MGFIYSLSHLISYDCLLLGPFWLNFFSFVPFISSKKALKGFKKHFDPCLFTLKCSIDDNNSILKGFEKALTQFKLGRDNFYHRESISHEKA